jgi:hypothetical protein
MALSCSQKWKTHRATAAELVFQGRAVFLFDNCCREVKAAALVFRLGGKKGDAVSNN